MPYDLIAISVILAILGGCIALAVRQSEKKGEEKAKRERAESDLHSAAELMGEVKDAYNIREKAIADTRAGNVPDRLRAYYRKVPE